MSENTEKLIGIEVSSKYLRAVCLKKPDEIIDFFEKAVNKESDIVFQIISLIEELKEKFGNFNRVGIAVSGLVDRRKNRLVLSNQIPTDIDIVQEIQQNTGILVFLENDANSGAFGEFTQGAGRGNRDMFYAYLGEGVGGAIILDSKLWRGNSGFAGEFGHLAINSQGMRIEEMASNQGIVLRTRNRFHQDSTSSLYAIGEENISIADIVREANHEDDFAKMMLERTGMFLGKAIASVINLLDIEKIVIGGDIMGAGDMVLLGVNESAREFAFAQSYESTHIVAGKLGTRAVAIGVALLSD